MTTRPLPLREVARGCRGDGRDSPESGLAAPWRAYSRRRRGLFRARTGRSLGLTLALPCWNGLRQHPQNYRKEEATVIDKRLVEAVPGAERLKSAMITPDLFVKDLMQDYSGRPLYTYEEWARELINHSNAFKELTRGAEFHAPASEANGECDAVSDAYQLDFKLIFGKSMMRAVSLTSSRRISGRGLTLELPGKSYEKEQRGLRLHAILRGYSLAMLDELLKTESNKQLSEEDFEARGLLRSINHSKNLLLIFPCRFEGIDRLPELEETVNAALYYDFRNVLDVRRIHHPGKDTFLSYFCDDRMVVTRASGHDLSKFDDIMVAKSRTYMDIMRMRDPGEYQRLLKLV